MFSYSLVPAIKRQRPSLVVFSVAFDQDAVKKLYLLFDAIKAAL